jgi:hypothetical protein
MAPPPGSPERSPPTPRTHSVAAATATQEEGTITAEDEDGPGIYRLKKLAVEFAIHIITI